MLSAVNVAHLLTVHTIFNVVTTLLLLCRPLREAYVAATRAQYKQDPDRGLAGLSAYGWTGDQGRKSAAMMETSYGRIVIFIWLAWFVHLLAGLLVPGYHFW